MRVYLWSSSWKIRAEILKQKAQSGMADSSCLDKNRRELGTHAELKGKCKQDSHFTISPCYPVSVRGFTDAICWIYLGFKNGIYTSNNTPVSPCTVALVVLERRKLKNNLSKINKNQRKWIPGWLHLKMTGVLYFHSDFWRIRVLITFFSRTLWSCSLFIHDTQDTGCLNCKSIDLFLRIDYML